MLIGEAPEQVLKSNFTRKKLFFQLEGQGIAHLIFPVNKRSGCASIWFCTMANFAFVPCSKASACWNSFRSCSSISICVVIS